MAVDSGIKHPVNAIVASGIPLIQFLRIETVANCYPGRLVKRDTTDHDIEVASTWASGSGAIGWLGYEQCHKLHRPANEDTIYVVEAHAPVLNGGRFVIVAALKDAETVVKGDPAVQATNGCVKLGSAATITIASGTTAVVSDKAQPDEAVAGAVGAEGPLVGFFEESMTASGITDCLVRSLI